VDRFLEFLMVASVAIVIGTVYALPTIIAFRRKHPNRWLIMVVNAAFGGTVIGWGIALVWALRFAHKNGDASEGGESGLNIFVNDTKKVQIVGTVDPASSLGHELERLHGLLTRGAISQGEFDALKAKLLASTA